ncbi:uncharacterized protein RJT20DRAFT_127639 [Scheffersomyces xylosifermentans]|uniref:uncharacterized protein n=1 Tax=Scheffersomyces xylosifermentans TaxID=1304137 RepID=UPI00315CFF24
MSTNNKVRPAKRLIETTAKCATEGTAYGECVLKNYTAMSHNACEKEFLQFKQCISKQLKGKRW